MASPRTSDAASRLITISLCGDVMTGRGIDQILPHPSDPVLYEPYVRDAREYVSLAEKANGAIRQPVDYGYIWGDALMEWDRVSPDIRIINLETSITKSDHPWPGKGIHYRMHPGNLPCITAARIDCCSLANNHVLDWGYDGLAETLKTLHDVGVETAGAGTNRSEAETPAVLDVPGKGRVLMLACGSETSGVLPSSAAGPDRPGVHLFEEASSVDIQRIRQAIARARPASDTGDDMTDDDIVVASLHWGPNWGYEVPAEQRRFAHALIDEAGVDLVYGHSSHHVKAMEVYRGRLILYGCGDFLDDYEGIKGYESFRDDLGLLYFATVDPATGELARLQMVPTQIRRMQVRRAGTDDATWLADVLNRESEAFGIHVEIDENEHLVLMQRQ